MRYHDGLASYTQNIHNLNMAPSSEPFLCDFIYVYCKIALPAVENPEEVERSVRAYVLSMQQQQQQASDDEIYEGLNTMYNEIGCPLNFYEETILHFEDKSGAAAAAQRKVPFGDTSGADEAAHRKVEKMASDALSQASKEFSKAQCICACLKIP